MAPARRRVHTPGARSPTAPRREACGRAHRWHRRRPGAQRLPCNCFDTASRAAAGNVSRATPRHGRQLLDCAGETAARIARRRMEPEGGHRAPDRGAGARGRIPAAPQARRGSVSLEGEPQADLELPFDVRTATLPEAGDLSERAGRRGRARIAEHRVVEDVVALDAELEPPLGRPSRRIGRPTGPPSTRQDRRTGSGPCCRSGRRSAGRRTRCRTTCPRCRCCRGRCKSPT